MKLICPTCNFSAETDPSLIPAHGTRVTCPRCNGLFPLSLPRNDAITCPKCGLEQDVAESCSRCGVIYGKYRAAEERRRRTATPESIEPAVNAETSPVPGCRSFRIGHGRGEVMAWCREGYITADNLPGAVSISGMLPGAAEWRRFLDGLALWLGGLFLAAAVIFFFAYNWQELGHFARFGIAELLLTAAVIASWRLGVERQSGKAALLVATLLVGALLALTGQTYQTGADTWELFANWALLVLPWIAISRFAPLWLVWLTLVNISVSLYFKTFGGFFGLVINTEGLFWSLSALNAGALAVWETVARRGVSWMVDRWPPRIVATAAAGSITLLACWGIVDRDSWGMAELLGYAASLAGTYIVYRRNNSDLYMLALGVLSLIVVMTVFLGHNLARHGDAGALLFVGMAVLGMSAAGGWWLRAVGQEVKA